MSLHIEELDKRLLWSTGISTIQGLASVTTRAALTVQELWAAGVTHQGLRT